MWIRLHCFIIEAMDAKRGTLIIFMLSLIIASSSAHSIKCYNHSHKHIRFSGTGLVNGIIDILAGVVIVVESLLEVVDLVVIDVATGVSVHLKLDASVNSVACVDDGDKVVLYKADGNGNKYGEPICPPF